MRIFFAVWSITNQILIYLHPFFAWGEKYANLDYWSINNNWMNKSKNEQKKHVHVLPPKFSRKRLKIKSSCPKLHLSSPLTYLLEKYSNLCKLTSELMLTQWIIFWWKMHNYNLNCTFLRFHKLEPDLNLLQERLIFFLGIPRKTLSFRVKFSNLYMVIGATPFLL